MDLLYKKSNSHILFIVLPKVQTLRFDCGVVVQLGFAAEFSNVMVIYTRVLETPANIMSCCAQLADFPVVRYFIYIHLNKINKFYQ